MATPPTVQQTRDALVSIRTRARTHRDTARNLEAKLAAKTDWRDLTEAGKQRRLREARDNLIADLRPEVDRAHQLAAAVVGDASERLSTARFFRQARFNDIDATQDTLQRILLELQLPRMKDGVLAAMAQDAANIGGDDQAALLYAIRRELDARPDASRQLKVAVIDAESRFPLPAALTKERAMVAEIAEAADAIGAAWSELQMPNVYTDRSDRVEFYKNGGEQPELPTTVAPEAKPRVLPFMIVGGGEQTDAGGNPPPAA